jgi:hypothetical protein
MQARPWDGHTERRQHNRLCGLTDEELKRFMEEVAAEGAKKALASIGLDDKNAYSDLKAVRGALSVFRVGVSSGFSWIIKTIMIVAVLIIVSFIVKEPVAKVMRTLPGVGN